MVLLHTQCLFLLLLQLCMGSQCVFEVWKMLLNKTLVLLMLLFCSEEVITLPEAFLLFLSSRERKYFKKHLLQKAVDKRRYWSNFWPDQVVVVFSFKKTKSMLPTVHAAQGQFHLFVIGNPLTNTASAVLAGIHFVSSCQTMEETSRTAAWIKTPGPSSTLQPCGLMQALPMHCAVKPGNC